jgi:glycine/D-amino acid oxidase-like deaminating enzyme
MDYLWEKDIEKPSYPALSGDTATEALVIGGGMAGVLIAKALHERGVACLLAEAKSIGSGVTRGTTAVLSAQHDTLYQDMVKRFSAASAKKYLDANLRAVEEFRALSQRIDCDFEKRPSYMYTFTDKDAEELEREAKVVRALGFKAVFTKSTPLPFAVKGAVIYPDMAQFHPLKFLYGAAKGLNIVENTLVCNVDNGVAYTAHGKIRARHIVMATHFPFIDRRGLYFMKLYQKRSFVIALENAPNLGATYVDTAESGIYLRNYKDLLILGGGDHRTGKKGGGFAAVRAFARRVFPDAREKYAWAAQDCMSLDGAPYIGAYSPAVPDLYVATGFNEWGMTSSLVASNILADMITGRKNKYAEAFEPRRTMLRAQLFANLGATLADFVIPTVKRCPHLGCALRWNKAEHTWDCPCHGSRFTEKGELINDPATRDAHV